MCGEAFWAKRFSNIHVMKALEALRAKGGVVPPTRFDKPRTPRNPNDPAPDPFAEQMDAKKAFEEALAYVEKRKDDDDTLKEVKDSCNDAFNRIHTCMNLV